MFVKVMPRENTDAASCAKKQNAMPFLLAVYMEYMRPGDLAALRRLDKSEYELCKARERAAASAVALERALEESRKVIARTDGFLAERAP